MTAQVDWLGDEEFQPEIKSISVRVKKYPVGKGMFLELPDGLTAEEANMRIDRFMNKLSQRDQTGGVNSFKW